MDAIIKAITNLEAARLESNKSLLEVIERLVKISNDEQASKLLGQATIACTKRGEDFSPKES